MTASNTKECFRHCIGKRVIGVLFDAIPVGNTRLSAGTKTLILDDGTGLTITSNGAFWIENQDEIERAIQRRQNELKRTQADLAEAAQADGAVNSTVV